MARKGADMEKKRLLIVGNTVSDDWEFRRGVEAATGKPWNVRVCVINRYDGLHRFTRFLTYFIGPLKIFLQRGRYEKIVSWEQFLGLILVFYLRLFHIKNAPEITVMALIYKPKKGLIGRLFEWFVRYTVTSDYIRQIVVFSRSEVDYYSKLFGIPKEKLRAEVVGIADRPDIPRGEPAVAEKYYISPGRSNRDYAFLRRAWPESAAPVHIVCDVEKSEDSGNVIYKKSCHGDEYLRLLAGAYACIVPLESQKFSSGQLVFLQSAMLGVPVISTQNDTVPEYVEDGVTGLTIDKTPEALRQALNTLDDPQTRERMSRSARARFEQYFSLFELGKRVGHYVK